MKGKKEANVLHRDLSLTRSASSPQDMQQSLRQTTECNPDSRLLGT